MKVKSERHDGVSEVEVNGQLHASVALPSWKDGGCVGPGICLDFGEEKNLCSLPGIEQRFLNFPFVYGN